MYWTEKNAAPVEVVALDRAADGRVGCGGGDKSPTGPPVRGGRYRWQLEPSSSSWCG